MKRILTILFVLVNSVIFSQATLTDLNLVFDISESNSYSSPFVVKGTVLHSTSEYNGNDINVGDLVYFQDGTTTYSLPIVTIDSQSYSYVELQLLDISSTVSYVPTGRAALIRTSNPDLLPVPPDGIPSDLEAGILNDLRLKIQGGVTAAEEITDYTGGIISSPMFPPAVSPSSYTGKTWRNSMGVLYRSDGVAWTPIGGAAFDTLYTDATNQLLVLQGPNDSLSTSIIDIAPVQQITGGTGISVVPYPGGVFNIVNAGDLSNTNEIELPSQVGNNLKALYTNGTSPYWGTVASSIDTFGVYGPNLLVSLLNDGQPAKSVTASSILSAANGVSGTSIAANQVAYGSGSNVLTSNSSFTFNPTGSLLRVNGGLGINRDAFGGRAIDITGGGIRLTGSVSGSFEVNGASSAFYVTTTGGSESILLSDNTTARMSLTGNSYKYEFQANASKFSIRDITAGGVDRILILPSGNVGIGSTNPAARLHVVGADALSTGYSLLVQDGSVSNTKLLRLNNIGELEIGNYSTSGGKITPGQISSIASTTYTSGILRFALDRTHSTSGLAAIAMNSEFGVTDGSLFSTVTTIAPTGTNTVSHTVLGINGMFSGSTSGDIFGTTTILGNNAGLNVALTGRHVNLRVSTQDSEVNSGSTWRGTAGATYTGILIDPTYNQQIGATGAVTGIDYNPVNTSVLGSHYGLLIRSGLSGFGTSAPTTTVDVDGTVRFRTYPNTLNTAGNPVNVLSTSSTGVVESHTPAEIVGTGFSTILGNGQIAYGTGTGVTGTNNLYWNGQYVGVNTGTTVLAPIHIGPGVSASSTYGSLYLQNGQPSLIQRCERESGGAIYNVLKGSLKNTTTGLETVTHQIGIYGNLQSGATAPTLISMYIGVGPDATVNNAAISINTAQTVSLKNTITTGVGNTSGTTTALFRNSDLASSLSVVDDGSLFFHLYPNTLNSSGNPINVLSTSSTGKLESHTAAELVSAAGGITGNGLANKIPVFSGTNTLTRYNGFSFIDETQGMLVGALQFNGFGTGSSYTGQGFSSPGANRTIYLNCGTNNNAADEASAVLNAGVLAGRNASTSFKGIKMYVDLQSNGGGTLNTFSMLTIEPLVRHAMTTIVGIDYNPVLTSQTNHYAALFRSGNVGIGANAPVAKLQVAGSGNNSTTWTAQFHNNATNNALMISDAGFVGVGLATQSSINTKFEVNSRGRFWNGVEFGQYGIAYLDGVGDYYKLATASDGFGFYNTSSYTSTGGNYNWATFASTVAPTTGSGSVSMIRARPTINIGASATHSVIGFDYNPVITSLGGGTHYAALFRSGNVGIGTATPVQTLHVQGTARITDSDGTATTIMGRDGDGDVSILGLGSGLSITSGVLNVTASGATNLAVTGTSSPLTLTSDTGTDVTFTAGTNVTLAGTSGNITINATEVDGSVTNEIQNLSLTGQTLAISGGTGATLPVIGITAGTGITATPTAGNFTITNTGDTNAADDLTTSTFFDGDIEGTWDALTLKTNVVGEDNIIDGSITAFKLAAQAASNGQVLTYGGALVGWVPSSAVGDVAGPITNLQIGANAVGTTELNNGAVTMAKINQASATTGQVITWNGTAWAPATPTTGPTYTAGTGINISSNVITNTGDTNAADDLTTSTSFSGDVTGLYNNLQIAANAVGTTELADNSVSANKIGDSQVTMAKINQSSATSGQIISWNGTTWAPSNIGYGGATDAIGTAESLTVTKIQNRGIATTAPTTGQVLAWSGTLWAPASPGLTSLNGQTGSTQTFFASSTGSDFGITSSGNVHTFVLPTANATQTGKLTSSDWTAFSNKIGGSGTTDQLAIFTGSGTISSSSSLSYASSTLTVAGDISPTGKLKAGTLGTSPTVIVGRNASNELSTVGVGAGLDFTGGTLSASNFYTADGTLTGSRTVTTGNLNIAFDASTSGTNNANPIRVKGISTSGNTYYPLIFQNESNADKLSFKVGASEVSMLTTTENLKLGTGSQQWILNNVGSITMPALASNPTTANSSMWVNSTTNRLMVKTPDGNVKAVATLQDDLAGTNLQFSISQSIGGTSYGNEITNTLTSDITITLDGTLTEGREYKLFNSNDGATWDTFWTVASGYTVKFKDYGNITSADGLLTMNPYRLFIITRYGNTIYVSY